MKWSSDSLMTLETFSFCLNSVSQVAPLVARTVTLNVLSFLSCWSCSACGSCCDMSAPLRSVCGSGVHLRPHQLSAGDRGRSSTRRPRGVVGLLSVRCAIGTGGGVVGGARMVVHARP